MRMRMRLGMGLDLEPEQGSLLFVGWERAEALFGLALQWRLAFSVVIKMGLGRDTYMGWRKRCNWSVACEGVLSSSS